MKWGLCFVTIYTVSPSDSKFPVFVKSLRDTSVPIIAFAICQYK